MEFPPFTPRNNGGRRELTVIDQSRMVAWQCDAWALSYRLTFSNETDVLGGNVTGKSLRKRLEMMSLPSGGALICGRAIQILRRAIAHCRK